MTNKATLLAYGALLHDIGKVVQRATAERKTHAKIGGDWLQSVFMDFNQADLKTIINQVKFHHAKALSQAKLADDDLAYITYFADNIASGTDRRPDEDESNYFNWDAMTNSADIFNVFGEEKADRYYQPGMVEDAKNPNFALSNAKKYTPGEYADIEQHLKNTLALIDLDEQSIQSIINLLEATMSFVPSSTNEDEVRDISLFDHSKLVASFAQAIYQYAEANNISNFKQLLFSNNNAFYDEPAFRLISYDISGIQSFIYTIVSSGAQKQLRSRSLYIDMMSEFISDQLLADLGLNRANLMYAGGGHAYMIAANTEETKKVLETFEKRINAFLIDKFDISLYLALDSVSFKATDMMVDYKKNNYSEVAKRYGNLYKKLSKKISEKKQRRYTVEELTLLNQSQSNTSNECLICHRVKNVQTNQLCDVCSALNDFSKAIQNDDYFVINEDSDGLPLIDGRFLHGIADQIKAIEILQSQANVILYSKNKFMTSKRQGVHIWNGDYHFTNDIAQYPTLSTGIKRLGVVRLDVDDLGYGFMAGFSEMDAGKYHTIGRTATFSRSMSLFFKLYINEFAKDLKITLIYAGGDDVFALGTWNDIIEFTVMLRTKFVQWSNHKLSMSAGIGVFNGKTPVNVMARQTGELEEAAKANQGKDSITIFDPKFTFKFDDFVQNVYEDKLPFIRNFFNESTKGKAFIYKIIELIRQRNDNDKISFARLAYLLARTEKLIANNEFDTFKQNIMRWYQDENEAKELELALMLYVYESREE